VSQDSPYTARLGTVGLALAIGMAYFMAAELGQALRAETGTSVFWPAAGISVGALIVLGPKARLPVAAGVFVATFLSNVTVGRNPWLAAAFGVVNAGQALLTTGLIERWFGRSFELRDVRQVLGFLMASTIGAAVAALGATIAFELIQSTASPITVWRVWFASCLLGIVTVAPLLVGVAEATRHVPPRRESVEGALALSILAALCAFVISLPQGPWSTAVPVVLVFPVLLWVIVRCRPVFAAAAAFVVALAVVWSITFSVGHFGDASVPLVDRILAAQTIVLAGALLTLVLAALFAERRRSEWVLERSRQRLQLALDGAELGTFSADLATGCFECDARAAQMLGCDVQPTTISESRRFVLPQDRARIDAALAQAQRADGVWNTEYRVVHPEGHRHAGETRWVAVEGSMVRDPHGTVVGLLGVTRDITDRRQTERALSEHNLQMAMAGKSARVGSYTYDVGSDLMQVSEGYVAVHGLPEGTKETTRSEWRARTLLEDLPEVEALREQAFRARLGEYAVEYRIVRSNGEVRWVESRSFISYDGEGRPERVVGVNIDITERKKAAQVAQRLASIVESSDDAIVSKDLDGMIVSWNQGAERLFGYSAEEVIGHSILLVVPPDRQHEELRILERIRSGGRLNHYETVRRHKDGTLVDVSLTVSPLRDVAGVVVGASKIARDIGLRKRAEEHQRTLNAELDHRAKNVLATVRAIIAQTRTASSSYADFVTSVDRRIDSLARTHDLLSESGWRGGSLADIAQRQFAPYAANNVDMNGPGVTLKADATQAVAMVLHELTTNAAKYGAFSSRSGRVTLSWSWIANGSRRRLAIEWQEINGPPVGAPSRCGYGTSTIRELIPFELGGAVDLAFTAEGVRCRIEIPAIWIHDGRWTFAAPKRRVSAQELALPLET
jgi:PAS domain S-box-containing protein